MCAQRNPRRVKRAASDQLKSKHATFFTETLLNAEETREVFIMY